MFQRMVRQQVAEAAKAQVPRAKITSTLRFASSSANLGKSSGWSCADLCSNAMFCPSMYPISRSPCTNACQRSEEHTSELQSRQYLVCRLLLEKKKNYKVLATVSAHWYYSGHTSYQMRATDSLKTQTLRRSVAYALRLGVQQTVVAVLTLSSV